MTYNVFSVTLNPTHFTSCRYCVMMRLIYSSLCGWLSVVVWSEGLLGRESERLAEEHAGPIVSTRKDEEETRQLPRWRDRHRRPLGDV